MNKFRNYQLFKYTLRRFSTHTEPTKSALEEVSVSRSLLTIFEITRVVLYFFLLVKLVLRAPSYIAFGVLHSKKPQNDPNYMLWDGKPLPKLESKL